MNGLGTGPFTYPRWGTRFTCCTALRRSASSKSGNDYRSREHVKSAAGNKPTHIVKGNIFDALGFSASEASALKIKAEILSAILEHVRAKGYTQAQLIEILD